jgi:membrane associated rhomboid family serine protease
MEENNETNGWKSPYELEREEEERELRKAQEEFLEKRRAKIRKRSLWAIGIGFFFTSLTVGSVYLLLNHFPYLLDQYGVPNYGFWGMLFRNILFLLGIFLVGGGVWGLLHARRIKIEDFTPSPEAMVFLDQIRTTRPTYSYFLVGSIVATYLVQLVTDSDSQVVGQLPNSIQIAGLIKPLVWQGEPWRLLTAATLHGGLLHIYFNSQAFYGFGTMVEMLANRAHLTIIFLLSVLGGSTLSLLMLPEGTSVGASGGILGLVGYLAVYGYRRKQHLPPDFFKNMMINVAFITAFGLVAWRLIDNWGHLGGFLIGLVYGGIQIPRNPHDDPRKISAITDAAGLFCLTVFVLTNVLVVLRLLDKI